MNDDYERFAGIVFSGWEQRQKQADLELEQEREAAAERSIEIAKALTEVVVPEVEGETPVEGRVELVKPQKDETISSDKFREITSPFNDVKDAGERRKIKDEFVKLFGNPTLLPVEKFDEALAWVKESVSGSGVEQVVEQVEESLPKKPKPMIR